MREQDDIAAVATTGGSRGSMATSSTITRADRLVHVLARLGVKRNGWRVEPGLYSLGEPGPGSPVFVSANYRLSFDALREGLERLDAYILVLDTRGINVWCAAGKGTFGTDELVERIESTGLADVVESRQLILPQLGATGVAAHEVRERSGFRVKYGPVRAGDIREYLRAGEATPEMRRIRFDLPDRVVLIPLESVHAFPLLAGASVAAYFADGAVAASGIAAAGIAGVAGFPVLLPWLPGEDFSVKGFALGAVVGLTTAAASAFHGGNGIGRAGRALRAVSYALALPPITALLGLNFTGSTPFASPSMVRREIFTYVPVMAGMAVSGIIINAAHRLVRSMRG